MLPSEVKAKKAELMKHVNDMKRERKVAAELHREAQGRSNILFEYDDKCGSQFLHLPCAPGERNGNAHAHGYAHTHNHAHAGTHTRAQTHARSNCK